MAKPPQNIDVLEQPARRLEDAFAKSSGGPLANRVGDDHTVVSERTLFGDVVMAQPTKAPRDEARILQRIKTMAAAAGEAWYYRFPVKTKRGGTDYIEGPSIECADAVARYYGNCRVDCAVVDQGRTWMIYSRFIDLETGYTLIRPFQQDKFSATLGGDDEGRKLAIALSTGTSKSQRNVVDHALKDFTSFAFEEAKKNIVERIGRQLPQYRERAVERINELGADFLRRVELAYGRKANEWLAPDLARIIAELRAIADGMANPDETWPPPAPAEPRRSDVIDVPAEPAPAAAEAQPQPGAQPVPPPAADPAPPAPPQLDEPLRKNWSLPPNLVGQDAVLKALHDLLGMVEAHPELDELEGQNADRIAKITGTKRAEWNNAVRSKREQLGARP